MKKLPAISVICNSYKQCTQGILSDVADVRSFSKYTYSAKCTNLLLGFVCR